jgi:hypothetical protein
MPDERFHCSLSSSDMWVHTLRHRLLRQRQTRVSCSSHVATSLRKLTGSYIAQVLRTGPFGTCPELLATRASLQQGPHRAQIKGSIDSCPRAISGCILCGTRLATSDLRLVGFKLTCLAEFNLRRVLGSSRPPTPFKCSGQVRLGRVRS